MADTTIKLSGTYDSIEAYRILEEMRDLSYDFNNIKEEAEAAASAATSAVTTAQTFANNASTYATNAQTYAGNANTSAGEAAGYASDASTAATNAATSETNASNSASAAATSESNASDSEAAASASATAAAASAAEAAATLQNYLPLAGGTMSGTVRTNQYVALASSSQNSDYLLSINGGYDDSHGGQIVLVGENFSANAGSVFLRPRNSNGYKEFIASVDGSLTWGGVPITDGTFIKVQSVNITNHVAASHVCDVTAPTVSGYQFVVWVSYSTNGFCCPLYFEKPTNTSSGMWTSIQLVSSVVTGSNKSITAYALYVRKW